MKFDLFIIACILIGADALDTVMVLKEGGRELNPFMRSMISKLGATEALLLSHGLFVAFMWAIYGYLSGYFFAVVAFAYFAIMLNNIRAYIQQRKS